MAQFISNEQIIDRQTYRPGQRVPASVDGNGRVLVASAPRSLPHLFLNKTTTGEEALTPSMNLLAVKTSAGNAPAVGATITGQSSAATATVIGIYYVTNDLVGAILLEVGAGVYTAGETVQDGAGFTAVVKQSNTTMLQPVLSHIKLHNTGGNAAESIIRVASGVDDGQIRLLTAASGGKDVWTPEFVGRPGQQITIECDAIPDLRVSCAWHVEIVPS